MFLGGKKRGGQRKLPGRMGRKKLRRTPGGEAGHGVEKKGRRTL